MAHVNYEELQYCVENFKPYTHGSSHAINSNGTYTIVSYSTPNCNCRKGARRHVHLPTAKPEILYYHLTATEYHPQGMEIRKPH